MSNAAATENEKPGASFNWRQRKKLVSRRKQLVDGYTAMMLGGSLTDIQKRDIERAADLIMLAEATRQRALRGEAIRIEAITMLETAADKAVRRLGLPSPGAAAVVNGLHDIVARHAVARTDSSEGD